MEECTDEQIAAKLPDYWTGHLSGEERLAVEAHLPHCESCRKSLQTMDLIAGTGAGRTVDKGSDHISQELLASYHARRDSLDSNTLDRVRQHLAACRDCSTDLEFIVSLEKELRTPIVKGIALRSPIAGFLEHLRGTLLRPVVALPVLILLVFLAVKWFRPQLPKETSETTVAAGILLKELRRSGGEPATVVRDRDAVVLRLDLPHYALPSEMEYSVLLSDPRDQRSLNARIGLRLGEKGIVHLTVDPRSLADGDYDLTLLEISRSTPQDTSSFVFPFKLVTAGAAR